MALISEGQEYSSPSKRIKLDQAQHLSNSNVELDFGAFSAPLKNVHEGVEGEYSVNAEIMNSGDSGFNEMGSATANMKSSGPCTPALDISTNSSNRSDNDGGTRDDDRDEVSSTVSYLSDISGLSDLSGQEWKPMAGPMSWIQRQMITGVNPRNLLNQLVTDGTQIPPQMDDLTLWKIIVNMMSEPPRRQKLRHINLLSDVVRLLKGAKKIIVLTGAGVSVSCGIPDFRSRDGIYSRLAIDFPDLPDPQAMFDIQYFSQDPRPFFKFAREIYPGLFKPSPCHRFIKILEKHKKLLRNYSQNIDTLEQVAGIENVIECHGSFATASCTRCKHKVTADEIRKDIFEQRIPLCTVCPKEVLPHMNENENKYESYRGLVSQGIMKPDIVFFGEGLPEVFHESMAKDKDECDLLIVIGSSLKVRPVALIPSSIPAEVPQILINREPLPHFNFDVELLGDSDVIINQLCHMMGDNWKEGCWLPSPLAEATHLLPQSSRHKEKDRDRDSGQGADCSSQDSLVNRSVSSRSTGDRMMNIENSEADSLQMSIDSGVSLSTADSSCNVPKERHMSVDSSTLDSGVGLSADSPTDSCRSSGHIHMTGDSTKVLGVCEMHIDSGKECVTGSGDSGCESISKGKAAEGSFAVSSFIGNKNSNMVMDSALSRQNTLEVSDEKLSLNRNCDTHQHMSMESLQNLSDSCNRMESNRNDRATKERRLSVDSSDEHPKSEDDLEILRACWQPKIRESLASRLPETTYYHLAPNRYIFPGAEVYYDPDDMEHSSYSSSSSSEPSDSVNNSSAEDSDNEDAEEGEFWDEEGVTIPECSP